MGRFLKEAREKAGLTQQDLAGVFRYSSSQFISNWERGLSLPPVDLMAKLAAVLRISPRDLVEELYAYQTELLKLQKKALVATIQKRMSSLKR